MIIEGKRIITFVIHKDEEYVISMADTENLTQNGYKTAEFRIIPENIGRISSLVTNDKYAYVGFGNKYKDNIILNYIIKNSKILCTVSKGYVTEHIEQVLDKILKEQDQELEKQYKYVTLFNSFDLQRFLFPKDEMMPLESFVKASDYTFTDQEHDVTNIANILNESKKRIDARIKIEEIYNEDLFDGHEGVMGAKLIKSLYAKEMGLKPKDLNFRGASVKEVSLKDIILPVIKFRSEQLNMLLEDLNKITIGIDENWWYYVSYRQCSMTMNLAGLRMNIEPTKLCSDEYGDVFNVDVASFFPTISCTYGIKPQQVKEPFLEIFKDILKNRLSFKSTDIDVSTAMKFMLNGIIGQFMVDNSWLYDPKASFKIRINGALLMLMLIERLYDEFNIECVTIDGMFVKSRTKGVENRLREIVEEWSNETLLKADIKKYNYVYMLSNNDYLTSDGTVKGFFSYQNNNGKTRKPEIIVKAVTESLLNGTSVNETITKCDDVKQFVSSISSSQPLEWCGEVFNNARFYYSMDQRINKIKDDYAFNVTTTPITQYGVTITDTMIDEIPDDINYQYYISEANKITEKINVQQLKLF